VARIAIKSDASAGRAGPPAEVAGPNSYSADRVRSTDAKADNLLQRFLDVPWLPVTLLIRADKLCIGQDVTPHYSLDLRFRRVS